MTNDPFAHLADDLSLLPPPTSRKGYYKPRTDGKTLEGDLDQLGRDGDPEVTGRATKRAKAVCHNARSRKYLEKAGYRVTRLEQWRNLKSGFSCKVDYLGLFDFEGLRDGQPRLLVQVCGSSGVGSHLRMMTSDKKAMDNQRPRLENLLHCLNQGWKCRLLVWTKQSNGRYEPSIVKVDREMVDTYVARKRNKG